MRLSNWLRVLGVFLIVFGGVSIPDIPVSQEIMICGGLIGGTILLSFSDTLERGSRCTNATSDTRSSITR